ncbi:hypothetical protein [Pseudoalteromonas sp. S2755]|uniref:hypothetical protein n=1 Tax=Pseudoalteromonas sp. S2755 TaxID=2066523 RepID=UPI00110C1C01|nr:hypothetical protein [Pseudoalteromonas sp. S2755]TMN35349.1 hypothetical protein CWC03_15515 [Pseudoalteromonas sp. S2755]
MKNSILFASLFTMFSSSVIADEEHSFEVDSYSNHYLSSTEYEVNKAPLYTQQEFLALAEELTNRIVPYTYVGGQRFTLDKQDFAPIFRSIIGAPKVLRYITRYETRLNIDGDFGQLLNFDISGSFSRNADISISCGSFGASAKGVQAMQVHTQQVTGGSCKQMLISVAAECKAWYCRLPINVVPINREIEAFDFTILVSENLN